jgi:hypothetical protein
MVMSGSHFPAATVLPVELNQRFLRAREAVTAALEALDKAEGVGNAEQYRALAAARHRVARLYREARAINQHSPLEETLWFALDEAALWQDLQADRYGLLAGDGGAPDSHPG